MATVTRPAGRLLPIAALTPGLSVTATAQDRPNIKPGCLPRRGGCGYGSSFSHFSLMLGRQ